MNLIETPDNQFVDGNRRVPGTPVPAWWLNQQQNELIKVIREAGVEPDKNRHDQLLQALKVLIPELGGGPVESIAALRLKNGKQGQVSIVQGYYADQPNVGGGVFVADHSDKTTPDNGGTVIVDAGGMRWKRLVSRVTPQMFGARSDGLNDDTAAINAAAAVDMPMLMPPGKYLINGDIRISGKAGNLPGGYAVEATGAELVGSGKIVLDSCKRVKLVGLDAPDMTLALRGVWYSEMNHIRIKTIQFGDLAGQSFSSHYWIRFSGCLYQKIIADEHADNANEIIFDGCFGRGNAGQNFKGTADYCIDIRMPTKNIQAWKFFGGDISYHTKEIINISPSATGEVEILFQGVYFDSLFPKRLNRAKTRIITERCHSANDLGYVCDLSAASRGSTDSWRGDRSTSLLSISIHNMIPNGDLATPVVYNGQQSSNVPAPFRSLGGATFNYASDDTSPTGRKVTISQQTTGIVFFNAEKIAVPAAYTCVLCIKAADSHTKSIQIGFNRLYKVIDLTQDWQIFTLTSGANISKGETPSIALNDTSGKNWSIDVCYAAVTMGETGLLFLPITSTKA